MKKRSRPAVKSPKGSKVEPEFELTHEQWLLIEDLFLEIPVGSKGGRPVAASRHCFEGILGYFALERGGMTCLHISLREQLVGVATGARPDPASHQDSAEVN